MMGQAHSQCAGQGFDPPLLHQLFQRITASAVAGCFDQVTKTWRTSEYPSNCAIVNASHPASSLVPTWPEDLSRSVLQGRLFCRQCESLLHNPQHIYLEAVQGYEPPHSRQRQIRLFLTRCHMSAGCLRAMIIAASSPGTRWSQLS